MAAGVVVIDAALLLLLEAVWMVPPLPNSRMVTVVCLVAAALLARAVMLNREVMNFMIIIIQLINVSIHCY